MLAEEKTFVVGIGNKSPTLVNVHIPPQLTALGHFQKKVLEGDKFYAKPPDDQIGWWVQYAACNRDSPLLTWTDEEVDRLEDEEFKKAVYRARRVMREVNDELSRVLTERHRHAQERNEFKNRLRTT